MDSAAIDLAALEPWKIALILDHHDVARHLVARQLGAGGGDHVGGFEEMAGAGHHRRHVLAAIGVFDAHHECEHHVGMFHDHDFDLAWSDIHPRGLDQVAEEVQVSVCIEAASVARAIPPVGVEDLFSNRTQVPRELTAPSELHNRES